MALDKLLTVLRREGEAEAVATVAAAEAEAIAIRERCEADLEAIRRRLTAELDRLRQSEVEQALAAARRDTRRAVLEARERVLERVFEAARARFVPALASEDFLRELPDQWEQALACLGDRPGTLRCHPAIRSQLAGRLPPGGRVKLEADPAVGAGFRLLSEDGRVEIDGTLEDRLVRQATRMRQLVVRELGEAP